MPRGPKLDQDRLISELRKLLTNGPSKAGEVCSRLNISQSSFSRMASRFPKDIMAAGRAGRTMYALRRDIPDVGGSVVVQRIGENGKVSKFGELHAVCPRGFYFEPAGRDSGTEKFFDDLPYFIDDLRPNGFLGRLIPRIHPELDLPNDIRDWSANDVLKYLTRYGCDLVGDIILGDAAFELYLKKYLGEPEHVKREERETKYPELAARVLQSGDPGSSAGGEQPKFPAVVGPEMRPVLVKFSPKLENDIGRRRADLLICEHLALKLLKERGCSETVSAIVRGNDQVFLETERFDRACGHGRKGIISLAALSKEFVGKMEGWTDVSRELLAQGRIDKKTFDAVRWREMFGRLIANTDMHLANISFYFSGEKILGLAPVYDMLPMLYAPQNEQIVERAFSSPHPGASDLDIWADVWNTGRDFWAAVSKDPMISDDFRKIAQANFEELQSMEGLQKLL